MHLDLICYGDIRWVYEWFVSNCRLAIQLHASLCVNHPQEIGQTHWPRIPCTSCEALSRGPQVLAVIKRIYIVAWKTTPFVALSRGPHCQKGNLRRAMGNHAFVCH